MQYARVGLFCVNIDLTCDSGDSGIFVFTSEFKSVRPGAKNKRLV